MKLSKMLVINAARKSDSIPKLIALLGFDEMHEEEAWEKIISVVPNVESFIDRNESLYNMRISKSDGDIESIKEHRLAFISAASKLMDSKLVINKASRNEVSSFIQEVETKSVKKRRVKSDESISKSRIYEKEDEINLDGVEIATEVPGDILSRVVGKQDD